MRVDAPGSVRPRVVIDTNVWISAALGGRGAPGLVVRKVLSEGIPVLSAENFAELEARFWRPKFDKYLSMDLRKRILHDLDAAAHWVRIPPGLANRAWCRDADPDVASGLRTAPGA